MLPSIFKTCALDKGYDSKCIPVTINDHNYYLSYCLRQAWNSLFVLINVFWARFFAQPPTSLFRQILKNVKMRRNKSLPLGLWLCFRIKKVYDNTEIFH